MQLNNLAMSFQLVCNYKNCLKAISNVGWATVCSHIFCEEHGSTLKLHWRSLSCPACGSRFEGVFSIIETRINPSEEYKTVALFGLKPDIVLQMASNAIAFWIYQCDQESKMLRNKAEYYKSKLASTKTEIESSRASYKQITDELQSKLNEANEKIKKLTLEVMEKDRIISFLRRAELSRGHNDSFY